MKRQISLLLAAALAAGCATADELAPNLLVWQYNANTLSRKQYLKDELMRE